MTDEAGLPLVPAGATGPNVVPDKDTTVHIPRDPAATGTVDDLRHEELISIHTSLGNICGVHKSRWKRRMELEKLFGALAILCLGGFIGGCIALFPYLSTSPSHGAKWTYIAVLAVAAFVGLLSGLARYGIHDKEIESVETVYERVDRIKKSYETGAKP